MRKAAITLLVLLGVVLGVSPAAAGTYGEVEVSPASVGPGQTVEVTVVCPNAVHTTYSASSDGFVEGTIELSNWRGTATAVSTPGTYLVHAFCYDFKLHDVWGELTVT